MLTIKSVTLRNFQSVGNVQQGVNLAEPNITLVLGENLDLGGSGQKNGVGKTAFVSAICYGLYGEAIGKIKKDNLINKINGKDMLVTIDFEINSTAYRIERGRKPNVLRFFVNGKTFGSNEVDEAQGDNKETQAEIEKVVGMSCDLFRHIVSLNTEVLPFLSLSANDQRNIIEELLGITKLSEKANKLRELIKITKDDIKEEEWKNKSAIENNKRIEDNIKSIEISSSAWEKSKQKRISNLEQDIINYSDVNIDDEISFHKHNEKVSENIQSVTILTKEIKKINSQVKEIDAKIKSIEERLASLDDNECPTCKQGIHSDLHHSIEKECKIQLTNCQLESFNLHQKKEEVNNALNSINTDTLKETFYNGVEEAYKHQAYIENIIEKLNTEKNSVNPYVEQIDRLKLTAIQEISYEKINELSKKRDHQEFLLKLLTNKDSFIRRKIIDHNLSYLNSRLSFFLDKMSLPHEVKFRSDLEVEITQYGKDYDFANLSRGEKTRLVLSLSWSLRDVYESLNDRVNIILVDELIDSGLDTSGVESALAVLKQMVRDSNRTCYLISHRDELIGRVDEILKVTKENGFTTFSKADTNLI